MQLLAVGGIFWRLDTSGNLTAYDTSGTTLAKFVGGLFSGKFNRGTPASSTPIASTTSLSDVHSGYYAQITPRVSGNVIAFAELQVSNSTAGDGSILRFVSKSGAQTPAGGSAIDGTWTYIASTATAVFTSGTANAQGEVTVATVQTGLTLGTVYTFSIGCRANVGGTMSLTPQNNHPIVIEV